MKTEKTVEYEAREGVAARKNSLQQLSPCRNVKLPHAAQVCASSGSNNNSYTNNNNNMRGGSKKMKTIKIIFTRTFAVVSVSVAVLVVFFFIIVYE